MASLSTSQSKEEQFFAQKRPWSRIKDAVVGPYLVPYFQKVKRLGLRILIIEPYAGAGKFADGSPGSPLLITGIAERIVPGQYHAIFGNKRERTHEKLSTLLKPLIDKGRVETLNLPAEELLLKLGTTLGRQTVFLYLDPYGLPPAFYTLKSFIERDASTEFLINIPPSAIHRVAAHKGPRGLVDSLHQALSKSLGNSYWRSVYEVPSLTASQRAERVIDEYRSRIKATMPYSGKCPIRKQDGSAVKYYMCFFSRHPDAVKLYNDVMRSAYRDGMYTAMTKGTLFDGIAPMVDIESDAVAKLKALVLEVLSKGRKESRERIWLAILDEHLLQFSHSNYIRAVKELCADGVIGFEDIKGTKKLNDDAVLYLRKGAQDGAIATASPEVKPQTGVRARPRVTLESIDLRHPTPIR
jgi:three-Cys-motif partner protein